MINYRDKLSGLVTHEAPEPSERDGEEEGGPGDGTPEVVYLADDDGPAQPDAEQQRQDEGEAGPYHRQREDAGAWLNYRQNWWWNAGWPGPGGWNWDRGSERSAATQRSKISQKTRVTGTVHFSPTVIESLHSKAWSAIQRFSKLVDKDAEEDKDVEALVQLLGNHREGFFPDTFTSWLMLMRSGLGAHERSAVLGKTDDSLRQKDVETALVKLWMDYDINDGDKKKGIHVQRGFKVEEMVSEDG